MGTRKETREHGMARYRGRSNQPLGIMSATGGIKDAPPGPGAFALFNPSWKDPSEVYAGLLHLSHYVPHLIRLRKQRVNPMKARVS